jgi:CheY-like chemotaxis protein
MNEKCLLLVEDDSELRFLIAEAFFDAGFEVVEAEDGDQAVELAENLKQLDVLVTDIQMPGRLDGNEVATRARGRHPGLQVVYMSGDPASLTNGIGPCDAFLCKPFRSFVVISEVARLLAVAEAQC